MLTAYICENGRLQTVSADVLSGRLENAIWIDLLRPTVQEMERTAAATGLRVPTQADLSEIETSSRLSVRQGALYLSIPLIAHEETGHRPIPAGFVLSPERLITIRFASSGLFDHFAAATSRGADRHESSSHLLVGLLEAIVDRQADELEQVRAELDTISHRVFDRERTARRGQKREDGLLSEILVTIGQTGDLISFIRDTQLAAGRIVPFVQAQAGQWLPKDLGPRLDTLRQDISSLNDFDTHLNDKLQFLLDATLGFINVSQNTVMKVLTVASVVGIPPVLVAGIYGMNFKSIPEYDWAWGYAYGLGMIALTAVIPLIWFRVRGWI
jgi:magnesium transporter